MNGQIDKTLKNVKYIYDEDLWFFSPDSQFNIICYWVSKINPHNNKLYYINPRIYYYQTT